MVNDNLPNNGNSDHVSTTLQSSSFLIKMFSIFGVIVVLYFIKYSVLTETNDSFFHIKQKILIQKVLSSY